VLLTIGAAIVVLGVLIFVHELGHFMAAKSVGIAVQRFSFGLGPRTPLAVRIGETEYCLSWVPFGGYVKMAGLEDEGAAGSMEGPRELAAVPPERTFDAKPLWARVFVISAGVMMNALFAVVVYSVLAGIYGVRSDPTTTVGEVRTDSLPMGAAPLGSIRPGERIVRINGDTIRDWDDVQKALLTSQPTPMRIELAGRAEAVLVDVPLREQEARAAVLRALVPWHEPVIGDVVPGYPASGAGVQRGDRVLRVGADTIRSWETFVQAIEAGAARPLDGVLLRDGREVAFTMTPRATRVVAGNGRPARTVGRVGLAPYFPVTRYGPVGAIWQGTRQAAQNAGLVLFTLKGLVTGALSPRDLGGPIMVGQLSGEYARLGIDAFLGFMALFSINLAVLNLLPIPVLDGGHLVFLLVEGVRRRPLSVVQRQRFTQIGFFVLVAIMLLAIANDVTRVFGHLLGR
jgi:regulator of sigma E protease